MDEIITVTVRLRRKKELPQGELLSREMYARDYAASQEDIEKVEAFAHSHLLTTVEADLGRRSVILRGKLSDFEKAFSTTLKSTNTFRAMTADASVPDNLKDIVVGVFGLDNRPIARPMFQISHAASPQAFTADQLAKIYGFPTGVTGKGQCIGIIELGGGFKPADITNYFKSLGISAPTVKAIAVDDGKNAPTTPDGADGEVMLDI